MTTGTDTETEKLAQALRDALPYVQEEARKYADDGSNEPLELVREIEELLEGHDCRAQPARMKPQPDGLPNPPVMQGPAQPASLADRYRQIGWVHPVYLDQHMGAGALAIEVSQPRLSDAQIPVFVRAAAPQPPVKGVDHE